MSGWWERHGVPRLIKCACSQGQIMKARSKVVPAAAGDVLELGCGGGINMEFYDWNRVTRFTGLDPSPELLAMSRAAAQARGIAATIEGGVGEAMPFESGRFDTVVTTFTLCSVHDQAAVLAEIRRVLKPGGTALFLEHGRAPDAGVARWQRRIEPVWKRIGGNCHLTRPIADAYAGAGFAVERQAAHYMPKTLIWAAYTSGRRIGFACVINTLFPCITAGRFSSGDIISIWAGSTGDRSVRRAVRQRRTTTTLLRSWSATASAVGPATLPTIILSGPTQSMTSSACRAASKSRAAMPSRSIARNRAPRWKDCARMRSPIVAASPLMSRSKRCGANHAGSG